MHGVVCSLFQGEIDPAVHGGVCSLFQDEIDWLCGVVYSLFQDEIDPAVHGGVYSLFQDEIDPALLALLQQQQARKERKPKKLTPEQADAKRRKIWVSIAKKEIPKVGSEHVS